MELVLSAKIVNLVLDVNREKLKYFWFLPFFIFSYSGILTNLSVCFCLSFVVVFFGQQFVVEKLHVFDVMQTQTEIMALNYWICGLIKLFNLIMFWFHSCRIAVMCTYWCILYSFSSSIVCVEGKICTLAWFGESSLFFFSVLLFNGQ